MMLMNDDEERKKKKMRKRTESKVDNSHMGLNQMCFAPAFCIS